MKKIISVLIITLIYSSIFSQETYRISKEEIVKINKINSNIYTSIMMVENVLNMNNQSLKYNSSITNPSIGIIKQSYNENQLTSSQIENIESIICYNCYENEWLKQQSESRLLNEKTKFKNDSLKNINTIKLDSIKENKNLKVVKSDNNTFELNKTPYELLSLNLSGVRQTNRFITPFIGLDVNYSMPNLSNFIQSDLLLNSINFSVNKNILTEKFTPKLIVNNLKEYIQVSYNTKTTTGIIGYSSDASSVAQIESIEIIGTKDLIINLYVKFWDTKIKTGDFTKGQIAQQQFYGDKIILYYVEPNLYKIKIIQGDLLFNYESNFGINRKVQ